MPRPDPSDYPATTPDLSTLDAKLDALLLLCDRIRTTTGAGVGPAVQVRPEARDRRFNDLFSRTAELAEKIEAVEKRLAAVEQSAEASRRWISQHLREGGKS